MQNPTLRYEHLLEIVSGFSGIAAIVFFIVPSTFRSSHQRVVRYENDYEGPL